MALPTAEQVDLIVKGLERGLTDKQIADYVTGLKAIDVYNYRHKNGVSAETVLETRYANWIRLIEIGWSLESIGSVYGVKPISIRQLLNRRFGYKCSEAKKRILDSEVQLARSSVQTLSW
jgi:hypothetical protein